MNHYTSQYLIQAHPANKPFTNIGEIGQLFRNINILIVLIQ